MNIQEWFSPRERASNPLKIRYFPPRIPFPVLGHNYRKINITTFSFLFFEHGYLSYYTLFEVEMFCVQS